MLDVSLVGRYFLWPFFVSRLNAVKRPVLGSKSDSSTVFVQPYYFDMCFNEFNSVNQIE